MGLSVVNCRELSGGVFIYGIIDCKFLWIYGVEFYEAISWNSSHVISWNLFGVFIKISVGIYNVAIS